MNGFPVRNCRWSFYEEGAYSAGKVYIYGMEVRTDKIFKISFPGKDGRKWKNENKNLKIDIKQKKRKKIFIFYISLYLLYISWNTRHTWFK